MDLWFSLNNDILSRKLQEKPGVHVFTGKVPSNRHAWNLRLNIRNSAQESKTKYDPNAEEVNFGITVERESNDHEMKDIPALRSAAALHAIYTFFIFH